jgi:biopolymer transport protein ExbB
MFEGSLLQLIAKGGIAMVPLVICSVIIVAIIIERIWYIKKINLNPESLLIKIGQILKNGTVMEAVNLCNTYQSSPIIAIFKAGLLKYNRPKEELKEIIETTRIREERQLRKFTWILGTIGAVAPFIGLFGTVIGIIRAFRSIALTGAGGIEVVASGIAEALIATAGGLIVAITAVVAYNCFLIKINNITQDLKFHSQKFTELLTEIKKEVKAG